MDKHSPLADWLIAECNKRNLSWAEASRRAGISQNTISQIINGTPAGPKRLTALADYFGAPHQFIFELAGLLEPPPSENADPLTRRYIDELLDIWHTLKEIDPESAQRLMDIAIMQAQMVLLAAKGNNVQGQHSQREVQQGRVQPPQIKDECQEPKSFTKPSKS